MDCNNILTQNGNTPLNKLKQELELTKCNIYEKIYQYQIGYSI